MRELRATTRATVAERSYTAGEKEYLIWQECKKTDLPVNKPIQKELITIRDDVGLNNNRFSFEK